MSQKSPVPQAVSFVSQVLKRDTLRRSGNSWFGGRNRADNGIRIANWFCQRSCPSIWHLLVYACFPVSHRCSAKPTYS
jgi:hypothetical protein